MCNKVFTTQCADPFDYQQSLRMCCSVKILRSVALLFIFILWFFGVVVSSFGIWILIDPAAASFFSLHSTHAGLFQYVGWCLVGAGAIIIFIGFIGCLGAWQRNQCALAVFCCVLILVFSLELTAAATAFQKQNQLKMYVDSSMYDTLKNRYSSEKKFRDAFDYIQETFQCCGVQFYTDWLGTNWQTKNNNSEKFYEKTFGKIEYGIGSYGSNQGNIIGKIPSSCCNKRGKIVYPSDCGTTFDKAPLHTYSQFINNKGCSDLIFQQIDDSLNLIIFICVFFLFFQIMTIILSTTLCCFGNY